MAFIVVGLVSLAIGIVGLVGLESRSNIHGSSAENYSLKTMLTVILKSPQVTLFFWYLILLLVALLGQDIVLEPFAAQAFNMTVGETARLTSISGTATLIMILVAGALERRISRKIVAQIGNIGALIGFLLIVMSGFLLSRSVFYTGLVVFGAGTGLSTVANLALMFDLTLPGYMGLFIGAWGVSNALSRLAGNLMAGIVRDSVTVIAPDPLTGYMMVFGIEAVLLAIAIVMLTRIDSTAFHQQVAAPSTLERAALAE
jgi:BCD family chlorophyll transporter-like MFS transporter